MERRGVPTRVMCCPSALSLGGGGPELSLGCHPLLHAASWGSLGTGGSLCPTWGRDEEG